MGSFGTQSKQGCKSGMYPHWSGSWDRWRGSSKDDPPIHGVCWWTYKVWSGRQWFSWIHLDDFVNLICEAISNPSYEGVINGTSPNPVRLAEMCEHLGNAIGRPSWLPVPDFALQAVLGEGATLVLEEQKVLPTRVKEL